MKNNRFKIKYSKSTGKFRLESSSFSLSAFELNEKLHHNKWCIVEADEKSKELRSITIEETGERLIPDTSFVEKMNREKIAKEKMKKYREDYEKWENISNGDSIFINKTFVPNDTRKLILKDVDNFNLKLNRLVGFHEEKKDSKAKFFDKNKVFSIKENFGDFDFSQLHGRQNIMAEQFFGTNYKTLNKYLDWRLIHGLGGASVYETGITLHHIYGCPFIPSSSIKGVVRNWVIRKFFLKTDSSEESEKCAMKNSLFTFFFGSDSNSTEGKANRGHLMFFDAFPLYPPALDVDIINVHYQEYYNDETGKKTPSDCNLPIPIPFLTVSRKTNDGKNQGFKFLVGTTENRKISEIPGLVEGDVKIITEKINATPLVVLMEFLDEALRYQGIGAKTSVGYGFMN